MNAARKPAARDAGSATPPDNPLRETGTTLVARFCAAIRVGRSYDAENRVFVHQLELFFDALGPILDEHGEAVLVALDDDLFLNGVRLPIRSKNLKFHRAVRDDLQHRRIAGFRAQRGLKLDELNVFLRLFLMPETYVGRELLDACVEQHANRILPVIHASAEIPDFAGEWNDGRQGPSVPEFEDPIGVGLSFGAPGLGDTSTRGTSGSSTAARITPPGAASSPHGAAWKKYSAAMSGARSLLTTTSLQGAMELRHAKRVVQPLVDGAFQSEPVLLGLTSLHHREEYTYAHAVNVCLVAVSIGHHLGLDRRALADIGAAALLHDVGKQAVAPEIHHPFEDFTPAEKTAAERHPVEGARTIVGATTLNPTTLHCMRTALEHHMTIDGNGYPQLPDWTPSVLSQIVSLADCYVSLQTHRGERGATVTPYQALGMVVGPFKKRFDPALIWALVQAVGFYPPGQMVELDDGSVAMVLAPNRDDLARPHVRVMLDPSGHRSTQGEPLDHLPLPAERLVRRALRLEEYPKPEESTAV